MSTEKIKKPSLASLGFDVKKKWLGNFCWNI